MSVADTSIETIKENFPDIIGIWLFGSSASGTNLAASDIDLAIFLPQKTDNIKLWQCAQQIASKTNKEVDLIDLIDASTVLRAQVFREGKRIYCVDKYKCELFETESLADYLRFSDERKEILEDIKSRGTVLDG